MPNTIPQYFVGPYWTANFESGFTTFSCRADGVPRRVVSKALPLRITELAATYDLQKWLEERIGKGDNYVELGPQFARARAQFERLTAERKALADATH